MPGRPDALDLAQIVDGPKGTVPLPVGEDRLGGRGTDAGKLFELGGGCRVEVHRSGERGRFRFARLAGLSGRRC